MGTAVVTGAASGIGRAVVEQLEAQGDRVVGVDLKDVLVRCDLATRDGRQSAVAQCLEQTGGAIDRLVVAAGLGGHVKDGALVSAVNYFGAIEVLDGLRKAMEARPGAAAVVVCSNSAQLGPFKDHEFVKALLDHDEARAQELAAPIGGAGAYGMTKHALSRAVRRRAGEWGSAGVRLNGIAPGMTETPLFRGAADHPVYGQYIDQTPIPLGRHASADEIAGIIVFLLSEAASYFQGSIVWADGGTDAVLRPDDF